MSARTRQASRFLRNLGAVDCFSSNLRQSLLLFRRKTCTIMVSLIGRGYFMKFLHLSDLHLGKRVNEVSMLDDQDYILHQILEITDAEHPDAVVIAGDVYDKSVPSGEAVTLFDWFLVALAKRSIPVLLISGNHDSPGASCLRKPPAGRKRHPYLSCLRRPDSPCYITGRTRTRALLAAAVSQARVRKALLPG